VNSASSEGVWSLTKGNVVSGNGEWAFEGKNPVSVNAEPMDIKEEGGDFEEDFDSTLPDGAADAIPATAHAVLYDAKGNVIKEKTFTNSDKLTEDALMKKIESEFKVDEKAGQGLSIMMSMEGDGLSNIDAGQSFSTSEPFEGKDPVSSNIVNKKDDIGNLVDVPDADMPVDTVTPAIQKYVPDSIAAQIKDENGKTLKTVTIDNTDKLTMTQLAKKLEDQGFVANEKAGQLLTVKDAKYGDLCYACGEWTAYDADSLFNQSDKISTGFVGTDGDNIAYSGTDDKVSANPVQDVKDMVKSKAAGAIIYANGKAVGNIDSKNGSRDILQVIDIGDMKLATFLKKLGLQDGSTSTMKWTAIK